MTEPQQRAFLESLFHAAVDAAQPDLVMAGALPPPPVGRTVVIGAGKASAQMAAAFEALWPDPVEGLVVTRYGHGCTTRTIEIVEAGHPMPDAAGLDAAERIMALAQGLGPDDLLVALISGGGSALLPAPASGLSLELEQQIGIVLLHSGAPISVINAIRSEFSRIKNGRLAALAAPARVHTIAISDIPSDEPHLIASGPTLPGGITRGDVRRLVQAYGIDLPKAARDLLESEENIAPDPADPRFAANTCALVASAALSLDAAASLARGAGFATSIFSPAIEGEARDIGQMHAAIALASARTRHPFAAPAVLLSGGETTVSVRGSGRGGRNTEFLLAFALAIEGHTDICAIAGDTDGIDGTESNAGAICDGTSAMRMRRAGIDPRMALAANDSHTAFAAIGDLVVTGPTGTNVNDFRAIVIGPAPH